MKRNFALTDNGSRGGLKEEEVKLLIILVEINKKHGDLTIHWIKDVWGRRKKKVYLLFSHFPLIPHHTRTLITVLNADMKFSPHLSEPKGIGQQDTVSLPQQKKKKEKKKLLSRFTQTPTGEKLGRGHPPPHTDCIRDISLFFTLIQ